MRLKLLESITFSDTIDESVSIFVSTIEDCASPLFLRQLGAGSPQVSDAEGNFRKNNAPWFTEDCVSRRYDFYKCLNLFRGDNSDENRQNMVHASSKYKTCLRNARLLYDKSETDKLNKLRYKNAHDYWFRIALSRLRMSSHCLAIESGPTRTPLEERLCDLCNTLEDECHFVLECPAYSEFRCKYIHKY